MKKMTLLLAITVGLSTIAYTQDTHSSSTSVDEKKRIEFYAGYGVLTAQDIITALTSVVTGALLPGMVKRIDNSGVGAAFAGFDYYAARNFSIGLQLNYAAYTGKYLMNDNSSKTLRTSFLTPMARTKMNWVNRASFKFYSALAGGASLITSKNEAGESKTQTSLAFQISPAGIRVGKSVAFFAELGVGFQGTLSGGLSVKF